MILFGGTYHHNIDGKGRVNIPAPMRKQLSGDNADQVWVTKGLQQGCVFVYPHANWELRMQQLAALPPTEENAIITRMFSMNSFRAELDAQGRIVIPPQHQQDAGLMAGEAKDVVIVGVKDRIEIWNPQAHQRYLAQYQESYQKMVRTF
ncbi:MAG TPA: division/cell wall cluster transcriptional repressor MraZ [Candidatus Edwardsbacteria bacterium]|nr:division/cell wall cluster transcriptional repressor MraZ [Candidatus Edwardsbacteria bacterium]